jgi:hypothetical protein
MGQSEVLRMRRDLSGMTEAPRWPDGVVPATLGPRPDKKRVQAAHGVLAAGFWEGGGGAPIFRQWWQALRRGEAFDPALVFIAGEGADVIGMAHCWTSAFLKDLAVHPRARVLAAFKAFAARGASISR